jgi:hypothetical protein
MLAPAIQQQQQQVQRQEEVRGFLQVLAGPATEYDQTESSRSIKLPNILLLLTSSRGIQGRAQQQQLVSWLTPLLLLQHVAAAVRLLVLLLAASLIANLFMMSLMCQLSPGLLASMYWQR